VFLSHFSAKHSLRFLKRHLKILNHEIRQARIGTPGPQRREGLAGDRMQFDRLKRRDFIAVLAGAAAARPLASRAQAAARMWRIGFITHVANDAAFASLFERLRELGYVEGQNLIVERRYAQGRAERFPEFAEEMVRLHADVIITSTTPAALAARNATRTIPTVIPTAIDPVGTGLITSLAHPGGNITGGAILSAELGAKRLELLKEVVPDLARTAVLWNGANPANALAWRETEGAARVLGVTLQPHDVRSAKDFEIAFAAIAQQRPDALSVLTDALITQYQKEIVDFAIDRRLPSVFPNKEPIEAGGLMSYGPHFSEMMRRAASQVDKILRGARPADLPMEQPTTFELVINLKTARAMGLAVPPVMLSRADEVIE
jgi:putative tryptophan/tyrosine transport system substrate-binding protein